MDEIDIKCLVDQSNEDGKIINRDDDSLKNSGLEIKVELEEGEDMKCSMDQFIGNETILSREDLLENCVLSEIKIEADKDAECSNIDMFDRVKKEPKCDPCNYSSIEESNFHYNVVGVELNENKCGLSEELDHFANEQSKSVSCKCYMRDHCSSKESDLDNQEKKLHPEKEIPLKIKCHFCDYSTIREGELKTHMIDVHVEERKLKCYLCDHKAANRRLLTNHIKRDHLKDTTFKCHLCSYNPLHKCLLDVHIRHVHLKEKNFKCHLCNYGTTTKCRLKYHMQAVHIERYKL